MLVTAAQDIAYGARILVRGGRAQLADDSLANATAPGPERQPPLGADAFPGFRQGRQFFVTLDQAIGARCLHAIANGPIMNANRLYLPAGKLTEAQYRERMAAQMATLRKGEA